MRNKKLLLFTGVIALSLILGAVLWYIYRENNDSLGNESTKNEERQDSTLSEDVKVTFQRIEADRPEEPTELSREESFVYTEEIISPNSVAIKPGDYINKAITVKGWILENKNNTFVIKSINADEKNLLIISDNVDINFSDYKDDSIDSKPVYLEGVMSIEEDNSLAFKVNSVRL